MPRYKVTCSKLQRRDENKSPYSAERMCRASEWIVFHPHELLQPWRGRNLPDKWVCVREWQCFSRFNHRRFFPTLVCFFSPLASPAANPRYLKKENMQWYKPCPKSRYKASQQRVIDRHSALTFSETQCLQLCNHLGIPLLGIQDQAADAVMQHHRNKRERTAEM